MVRIFILGILGILGGCGTPDAESVDSSTLLDAGLVADAGSVDSATLLDAGPVADAGADAARPPPCAGCDADNDGFDEDVDCDDADPRIYPGMADSCTETCGSGVRRCQDDGTWSSCDCAPVCEATGSGRCFYVSASGGSDSDAGTFAAPWATYLNIVSYYASDDAPAGWVALAPGDVVYFMDGEYDATYAYAASTNGLFFRNVHGEDGYPITLRAYPGHRPVIARTRAVVLQSSFFVWDGIDVRDTRDRGILVRESDDVEILRAEVTGVTGPSSDNVAGIYLLSSERVVVHHSTIHDILAEGAGGNIWSHGVILFGGGNHRLHHNELYTSPPEMPPMRRSCVLYKHSATVDGSTFEVDHNIFRGCEGYALGSGSFGSNIHHNLFLGAGVKFRDFGGPTHNVDNVVSNNTFVGVGGLRYNPTDAWGPVGLTTFARNIVVDDTSYTAERGVLTIGTYISDSLFGQTVTAGNLSFDDNCYFNGAEELRFNLFAASGSYGDLGDIYDFAGWQALGYDTGSSVVDPMLDTDFAPTTPECVAAGWRAP